jgi:putative transposase
VPLSIPRNTPFDKNPVFLYNYTLRTGDIFLIKGYKFRIYPTEKQKEIFSQWFGSCRYIYNTLWEKYKSTKVPGKNRLQKDIIALKNQEAWLKQVPSQALQISSHHLEKAYIRAWDADKKKKRAFKIATAKTDKQKAKAREYGFPKFKSKHDNYQSFTVPQSVTLEKNQLSLPKLKETVRVVTHRKLPDKCVIKQATVSRKGNKYFVSLCVEDYQKEPEKTTFQNSVGIDLGLKTFAYLSKPLNGETDIQKPNFLKPALAKLQYLDKKLSKRRETYTTFINSRGQVAKVYSKNYYKLLEKRNRIYEHIVNKRLNFQHNLSAVITKQFDCVCVENLDIVAMMHDCNWARSIGDAAWGEFLRQLRYKCEWKGKYFVQLPKYTTTTCVCSVCKKEVAKIPLAQRYWTCPHCGAVHHRDENASCVIEEKGLDTLKLIPRDGMQLPEVTSVESGASKGPQDTETSLRREKPPLKPEQA